MLDPHARVLYCHRMMQAQLVLLFIGTGVDIYVLDTGINYDHMVFGNRASFGGYDAFENEQRFGRDCQGHGTHCAGLAAGYLTGAAYGARVYRYTLASVVHGYNHAILCM